MTVQSILEHEHPLLRKVATPVSSFDTELRQLVTDLFETMHAAQGIGLAAPQIARSVRLFVAEYEDRTVVMANPRIITASGETLDTEGCLSIPGYKGDRIRRAAWIIVEGQDAHGKPFRVEASDRFARVLQHEIDHLDGILYLDRLDRLEDLRRVTPSH